MKKSIFSICILFNMFTFSVLSQIEDLTIGFQLNPSISATEFSSGSKFTLNAGLEIQDRVSDHFLIESGIHLFTRGFIDRNISIIDPNGNTAEFTIELDRKMITVPITLMYTLGDLFIGAGANINYVFLSKSVTYQGNSVQGQTDLIINNNAVFGAQFMLGYNFSLSSRMSLDVETYYNTTFEEFRFYNFGIGIGLRFSI